MACPFCKSEKTKVSTPFVELDKFGKYVPKTSYCCNSAAKNAKYIARRFDPSLGNNIPDIEETSKL